MRILSRYIFRNFLFWLVLSTIGFLSLFVIVDLIDHLDNFIDRKAASPMLVVQYYLYSLPYNAMLCLPIAMLLSTLFTLGGLAKNNEILAMKASGITLYRIFAPILVFAFAVSGMMFLTGEFLMPVANERKEEIWEKTRGKTRVGNQQNVILQDVDGQVVFAGYYDAQQRAARNVSIERYSASSLLRRIVGKRMGWAGEGWLVEAGELWEFEVEDGRATQFDTLRVTSLTLLPSDFERRQKDPEEMSYWELQQYIERVHRNGGDASRWLVDLYLKISFPLINFIIVLFGAPVSTGTRRTGKALNFGIGVFVSFVYYGFIKSGQALGRNGLLHPIPAAWMANVLFFGLAVFLLIRARK